MKKIDFLKQNWIIGLIWSIPESFIALLILTSTNADTYAKVFIPIYVLIVSGAYHLNSWHTEERIDELEKEIDALQHKK